MKHRDDTEPMSPVFADEPLLVHQPRRRLNRILVLYALLPLICGAVGAYIAYELGNWRTDQRVDRLESDLNERRTARAAEDQARDARLEQTRRDLCVVLDRVQPRDAPLEEMRRRYGCVGRASPGPGPNVVPTPGRSPAAPSAQPGAGSGGVASAGGAAGPQAGSSGPGGATGPPGPPAPSAPPPRPPSPPAPEPAPEPSAGLQIDVCVPLLEVCVGAGLVAGGWVPPAP